MEDSTVTKRAVAPRAAVALKYSGAEKTPELVAAGVGDVARQILRLAEQAGVTITNQDSLPHILSKLEIDNSMPADSFPVVAEVLAFLYRADADFVRSKRA